LPQPRFPRAALDVILLPHRARAFLPKTRSHQEIKYESKV
jgi:hypothetical protein